MLDQLVVTAERIPPIQKNSPAILQLIFILKNKKTGFVENFKTEGFFLQPTQSKRQQLFDRFYNPQISILPQQLKKDTNLFLTEVCVFVELSQL